MADKKLIIANEQARKRNKHIPEFDRVLKTPDVFFGCNFELSTEETWIYDGEQKRMVYREVTYSRALLKIFDEIIVNARDRTIEDASVSYIKVVMNVETGEISVSNDGDGVPVIESNYVGKVGEYKAGENWLIPEQNFGLLGTGTNYEEEERVTGGKNGLGAKLTNRCSLEFKVETVDRHNKKKFVQVYRNRMTERDASVVTNTNQGSYTRITFRPDYSLLKMTGLDEDNLNMLTKRVYDMIACTSERVQVYLNEVLIEGRNLEDYASLYIGSRVEAPRIYAQLSNQKVKGGGKQSKYPDWEMCVCLSPDDVFRQISFVNGICTYKGGKHVEYVGGLLYKKVAEVINSGGKGLKVTGNTVKQFMWIFMNTTVVNPKFTNQAKEELITTMTDCNYSTQIDDKLAKMVCKMGNLLERIMQRAKYESEMSLTKTVDSGNGKLDVAKLEDARWASKKASGRCGCREKPDHMCGGSEQCTLILTEGDSAKAFAKAGISAYKRGDGATGDDIYGVFPLRGKFLNVLQATSKQMEENAELISLMKILGLKLGEVYKDTKRLRYAKVLLLTDQDDDGYHIKGLIMNLFHALWPSLLEIVGFLETMATPIVKMTRKGGNPKKPVIKAFYTQPEYQAWKNANGGGAGWTMKYYKGLGTSTEKEAKEIFVTIDEHKVEYYEDDPEVCRGALRLAFGKEKDSSNQRKTWINGYEPDVVISQTERQVSYADFVNKELIHFSHSDIIRSIPSMVDGLKPSQRKILCAALKRNLTHDLKVATFTGYVIEQMAYHHGEASIHEAIVGLAQDFMGSNNINYLVPSGQFGTRCGGGHDHASPRYIETRLTSLTATIFNPLDNALLRYQKDDDKRMIEPTWYLPVIPTVLLNGAQGIGTGYSTSSASFNPLDLIKNIRNLLEDRPLERMHPWYRKFTGKIEYAGRQKYYIRGNYRKLDGKTLEITELPVGVWYEKYDEFLKKLEKKSTLGGVTPSGKKVRQAKGGMKGGVGKVALKQKQQSEHALQGKIRDHYIPKTTENARITIEFNDVRTLDSIMRNVETFEKMLKLRTSVSLTNMHMFDAKDKIKKYDSAEEILQEFYEFRLGYYDKRKEYELRRLELHADVLSEKLRFVEGVIEKPAQIKIMDIPEEEVIAQLKEKGFKMFNQKKMLRMLNASMMEGESDEGADEVTVSEGVRCEEEVEVKQVNTVKKQVKKLVIKKKAEVLEEPKVKMEENEMNYDYLLNIRARDLGKEKVMQLREERAKAVKELETLKGKTSKDLWKYDLGELERAYMEWNVDDDGKKIVDQIKYIIPTVSPTSTPSVSGITSPVESGGATPVTSPPMLKRRKLTVISPKASKPAISVPSGPRKLTIKKAAVNNQNEVIIL